MGNRSWVRRGAVTRGGHLVILRQKLQRARCVETCTASGLEKRTSGNAKTALQADSTYRRRQGWTPANTDRR